MQLMQVRKHFYTREVGDFQVVLQPEGANMLLSHLPSYVGRPRNNAEARNEVFIGRITSTSFSAWPPLTGVLVMKGCEMKKMAAGTKFSLHAVG